MNQKSTSTGKQEWAAAKGAMKTQPKPALAVGCKPSAAKHGTPGCTPRKSCKTSR